jgi:N-acetylglucosamine kinase-like BadF-type ATPase
VRAATDQAGNLNVIMAALCFAGLDWDYEKSAFTAQVRAFEWGRQGLLVDTDTFPLLRAGTGEPTAVAVICGTGMNCVGRRADGQIAWFAAVGETSGDWGGGSTLGMESIWHASRAADGRGPATVLAELTPKALGCSSMAEVVLGFHTGRLAEAGIRHLAPVMFDAAARGDAVALRVIDRQADEIVAYALAAANRLGITGQTFPVVLGGGVIAAHHDCLLHAIDTKLATTLPKAYTVIVHDPPVLGAGLMAFDALRADDAVLARVRASLTSAPEPAAS